MRSNSSGIGTTQKLPHVSRKGVGASAVVQGTGEEGWGGETVE